jgi:hypothetical protein
VEIMKHLIMQFSPVSYDLFLLMSKYSPQIPIFQHLQRK